MKRQTITAATLACLVLLAVGLPVRAGEPAPKTLPNPFFVLSNGVQCEKYPTPEAQARVLKELGYAGIGPSGTAGVPEMLAALDEHDLKMFGLYVGANLDPDKPPYDPKLPEVIRTLKGRDTFIWLYVLSREFKRSSSDGDARAVEIIRELAAMAEQSGIRIALYPHAGFYVERVEDAVRVADKVDRKNVGVTFNLCHWLKLDEPSSMKRLMELARPRLFLVTVNGADHDAESWDRLIQPLDRGSFDLHGFLKTLKTKHFHHTIKLQRVGNGKLLPKAGQGFWFLILPV